MKLIESNASGSVIVFSPLDYQIGVASVLDVKTELVNSIIQVSAGNLLIISRNRLKQELMKIEVWFKFVLWCLVDHHLSVLVDISKLEIVLLVDKIIFTDAFKKNSDLLSFLWITKISNHLSKFVDRQFHIHIRFVWNRCIYAILFLTWPGLFLSEAFELIITLRIHYAFEGVLKVLNFHGYLLRSSEITHLLNEVARITVKTHI